MKIPAQQLAVGANTLPSFTVAKSFVNATVTIDRTVAGGLNSIPAGTTVDLEISYTEPGAALRGLGGIQLNSGVINIKGGGIVTADGFEISRGAEGAFLPNTVFSFTAAVVGQAVTIGGGTSNVVFS